MRKWLLLVFLSFLGCHGNNNREDTLRSQTESQERTNLSPAVPSSGLFSKQPCVADRQLQFAVYYPGDRKEGSRLPVFMLFDPHGDAELPLLLYKALADEYGIILLSSYDSKNGNSAEQTAGILQAMMRQLPYLNNADTSLVFCGGFSGGARVAGMLGLSPAGIKAIVSCGAGLPSGSWQGIPPHLIVAMAGNRDMNLLEVFQFKVADPQLRSRYQVIRFNGNHAWPPLAQMEQAIISCLSIAQRDGLTNRDTTILGAYLRQMKNMLAEEKDPVCKTENFKCLLKNFQGLIDLKKENEEFYQLSKSSTYQKALSAEERLFKEEEKIRNKFYQAIGSRDTLWWKSEISSLLDTSKITGDPQRINMLKRVQGALSLVIYMSLNRAIAGLKLDQELYFSSLYRMTDPENPEAWYLSSVVAAAVGNLGNAKNFLNTAFNKGFRDVDRCKKEPSFAPILNDFSFQSIINQ